MMDKKKKMIFQKPKPFRHADHIGIMIFHRLPIRQKHMLTQRTPVRIVPDDHITFLTSIHNTPHLSQSELLLRLPRFSGKIAF